MASVEKLRCLQNDNRVPESAFKMQKLPAESRLPVQDAEDGESVTNAHNHLTFLNK